MRNVLKKLAPLTLACGLVVAFGACSDDDNNTPGNEAGVDMKVGDMMAGDMPTGDLPTGDMMVGDMPAGDTTASNPYNTKAAIETFLDGKTLTMTGTDIPPYPLGYDENTNFGAATQCYNKTEIKVTTGPKFSVTSDLGTLNGAPNTGDTGTCDRTTISNNLTFDSTTVAIDNVATDGSCFDVTVTYTGFKQEGRAVVAADGKTVKMELYFEGQATKHRCADGVPGAAGVTVNTVALAGDSVQVYQVTTTN
jgi:hypothetical protein